MQVAVPFMLTRGATMSAVTSVARISRVTVYLATLRSNHSSLSRSEHTILELRTARSQWQLIARRGRANKPLARLREPLLQKRQQMARSSTTYSRKRSEERRVGKECRYRSQT